MTYALDHLEERTWAVIALDEASSGQVDYTIRMNFTVVPNTNHVVDIISIGLDPRYGVLFFILGCSFGFLRVFSFALRTYPSGGPISAYVCIYAGRCSKVVWCAIVRGEADTSSKRFHSSRTTVTSAFVMIFFNEIVVGLQCRSTRETL